MWRCNLLVLIFCAQAVAAPPTVDDARKFIDEAEAKLLALNIDAGRADWVKSTYITDDTEAMAAKADERAIAVQVDLVKQAKKFSGLKLPATNITVVHRSDSSGTTKGFTDFLSRYSPEWKSGPGVDKDIKWPTGTGGKGNEGVAAAVKQSEGAIGYVEQAYALQNGFTFADVKNKSGAYIAPTLASTSAAGDGIDVPDDLRINVIDSPNPKAYPITSQTFTITYQDPCKAGLDKNKAAGLQKFLNYLIGPEGQATIEKLSYAKLPSALQSKVKAAVDGMQCNGSPISG